MNYRLFSKLGTQWAFKSNNGNKNHPSPRRIRLIFAKFKALGTVADRHHSCRSRTVRSIDNIETVRQDVTHNPQNSVRLRSEELQICKTFLWRLLRGFKCYAYKIQRVQKIDQNDYETRLQFARSFIKIMFSVDY